MSLTAQLKYSSLISEADAQVFVFDGSVSTGLNPFLDFPVNGFTISFWIKTSQTESNALILSYSNDTNNRFCIKNPSALSINFGTGSINTQVSISDNFWHYLSVTIRPSDHTHFLVSVMKDGALVYNSTGALLSGQGFESGAPLVLGLGTGGEVNFIGQMSGFCFYSLVLPFDSIVNGMRVRNYGSPLISWLMDSIQNSGTINGTASFVPSNLNFLEEKLTASWSGETATSYELQLTDLTSGLISTYPGLSGSPFDIPDFNVNHEYQAIILVQGGTTSPATTALSINLQQVLPLITATVNESTVSCIANWLNADQTDNYLINFYKNGATSPFGTPLTASDPTLDLSSQVSSEDYWYFAIQSQTGNTLGPPTNALTPQAVDLEFYYFNDASSPYFELDWNFQDNIAEYFLEIFNRVSGVDTLVFQVFVEGNLNSLSLSTQQLNYLDGDVLTARIRAISSGTVGIWTDKVQLNVASLAAPVLSYNYLSSPEPDLQVTWNNVQDGASYWIKIYQDGSATPLISEKNITNLYYSVQAYMFDDHSYTILVCAMYQGSIGLANIPVSVPEADVSFIYDNANNSLLLSWASMPYALYEIEDLQSAGTLENMLLSPADSVSVTPPTGGFTEGLKYSSQLRPLAPGTMGSVSAGTTEIHLLAQPQTTYTYTDTPALSFVMSWPDVRTQAQITANLTVYYQVQMTIAGVAQPLINQTALSYDLSAYLPMSQSSEVSISIMAFTGATNQLVYGSESAASIVIPPAQDLNLSLVFDDITNTLTAYWDKGNPAYLKAYLTTDEGNASTHYAASTESSHQIPITNPTENQIYLVQLKSLPSGSISGIFTSQAIIHFFAAPQLSCAATSDGTGAQISWSDIRTTAQISAGLVITYQVQVSQNGLLISTQTVPNSDTGASFDLSTYLDQSGTFTSLVRGMADGSMGLQNSLPTLNQVQLNNFSYQQESALFSADWSAVTGVQLYYFNALEASVLVQQQAVNALQIVPFSIPGIQTGDQLNGEVRTLASGLITSFSTPVNITVHSLDGPTNLLMSADQSNGNISLSWTYATGDATLPSFRAALWKSGESPQYLTVNGVTSCNFTGLTLNLHDIYYAEVQALQDNSYGLWSQQQNTVIGLNCSLDISNVSPEPNGKGQVTVTWTNPECNSGTTFNVVICRTSIGCPDYSTENSSCQVVASAVARSSSSQTSYEINWADTQFANDDGSTQYCAQVQASQGGFNGNWTKGSNTFTKNQIATVGGGGSGNNGGGGDPVNMASGSYSYSGMDLELSSMNPINFISYYNTFTPIASENPAYTGLPMGNRWSHSYNTRIVTDSTNQKLYVLWGNGSVISYSIPSSVTGTYSQDGVPNGDSLYFGPYDQGNTNQYVLVNSQQFSYIFDASGKLTEIISINGKKTSLTYDSSNYLVKITNVQLGAFIQLAYDSNKRIKQLTDQTGRTVSYTYFSNGDLKSRMDPNGKLRSFTYSDSVLSLMATASDQNGSGQNTFIKNTYNTDKQVIFQQDARAVASGATYGFNFSYTESTVDGNIIVDTLITDRLGNTSSMKSVQANSNLLFLSYDLGGNIVRQITNSYDGVNNLLSQSIYEGDASNADQHTNNTASYTYDGNKKLLSLSYPDPIGQVAAFSYNALSQPTSFTDVYGNTRHFAYDTSNRLISITNALGSSKRITYYDSPEILSGMLKTITDELGNVSSYTYVNNSPYEVIEISSNGNSKHFTFDQLFNLTQLQLLDEASNVLKTITMSYDKMRNQLTKSIQYPGQNESDAYKTTNTYNDLNLLQSTQDALQNLTQYRYDANDLLQQLIYPAESGKTLTTVYDYDHNDNIEKITFAEGIDLQFSFDQLGRMLTEIDGNDNTFSFSYGMDLDTSGSYPSVQKSFYPNFDNAFPDLNCCIKETDVIGRTTKITNPAGNTIQISYDSLANPQLSGSFNLQVSYLLPPAVNGENPYTVIETYDPLGRLISYQDQAGNTTSVSYEIVQDPTKTSVFYSKVTVTDPLGNKNATTSNVQGKQIQNQIINSNGSQAALSSFLYDALGRIIQTTELLDAYTDVLTQYEYNYNPENNLIEMLIGNPGDFSSAVKASFNGLNQLVSETDALGNVVNRTYTPTGLPASITNGGGETIIYGYDAAQRYNSLSLPGSNTVLQILDGNGNSTATQLNGTTVIDRVFDSLNRLTARTNVSLNQTVGCEYNPMNQLTKLTYPDLKEVNYQYDNLQRMNLVTDWNNRQTAYRYNPGGTISGTDLPNGTNTQYSFDTAGRLSGIENKNGSLIISDFQFSYIDALGNKSFLNAILPLAPVTGSYVKHATYNGANELTQFNGADLSFDTDGNTTTLPGNTNQLNYTALNQLASFGTDTYTYDCDGLRTQTVINGLSLNFVQDINDYASPLIQQASANFNIQTAQLVEDVDGSVGIVPFTNQSSKSPLIFSQRSKPVNAQDQSATSINLGKIATPPDISNTITYLNTCQKMDNAMNRILQISDSNGKTTSYVYGQGLISSEDSDSNLRVYHYDNRGNTLALTDSNGKITDRYAYDPFGKLNTQSGNSFNPFLTNGRDGVVSDANGLIYMRARYYDSELQRFISRDYLFGSMYSPQTLNRYAFVTGNPISFIDPLGLGNKDDGWKIGLGIVGGVLGLAALGAGIYFLGSAILAYLGGYTALAAAEAGAMEMANLAADGLANEEGVVDTARLILRPGQSVNIGRGQALIRRIPFSAFPET